MIGNQAPFLFWSGPLSHWADIGFTVCGFQYCQGEQFLMHRKALLFGDRFVSFFPLSDEKYGAKQLRLAAKFPLSSLPDFPAFQEAVNEGVNPPEVRELYDWVREGASWF